MSAPDILQMRVTSKYLDDKKKKGPDGEHFLFSFLMRRETIPREAVPPAHVSTECLFFHPAWRLAPSRWK